MAFLDLPVLDRCQLKGKLNIVGFFESSSYIGFRKAHADSLAAVVTQLLIPSPSKLALASAFACVEISPSIVVAI